MELQLGLGLALPNNHNNTSSVGFNSRKDANKRSFEDTFGNSIRDELQMMPLLVWSGQPNEEDDPNKKKINSSTINKKEEEEEEKAVVGWPPIQTWRKKLLHQQRQRQQQQDQFGRIDNNNRIVDNSMFVKVKMEGVAIARKVDLSLYHSFETLANSLIAMFAKYQKCEKRDLRYTLTYQDKEGDWLLAGDIPWQNFIETVQRLRMLRRGG